MERNGTPCLYYFCNEFCTNAYRHNKQMASAPATLRYIYQAPVYQYYVGKIFVIKVPLCETVVAMTTTTMLVEVCTRLFAATPRAILRSHRRLFSERLRWRRFPLIMWSCISFNSRSACVQTVLNSAHTHTHTLGRIEWTIESEGKLQFSENKITKCDMRNFQLSRTLVPYKNNNERQ